MRTLQIAMLNPQQQIETGAGPQTEGEGTPASNEQGVPVSGLEQSTRGF